MKKMKKYLAFALAMGLVLSSMTVFAEENGSDETENTTQTPSNQTSYPGGTVTDAGSYSQFEGSEPPSSLVEKGDYWYNPATGVSKQWNGSAWVAVGCDTDSSDRSGSDSKSAAEKEAEERAAAEAAAVRAALLQASVEAVQLEAEAFESGFVNGAELQLANAAGKSAGEYNNNAVVTTPGIENAIPVAQGGALIIDGKVTGATATISKVSTAFVDSVRAAQEGTVLNVVDVDFPAVEATINFYMPGVAGGANIAAVQYADGTWANVDVVEVRADHVVLNLKDSGVVAFIAK